MALSSFFRWLEPSPSPAHPSSRGLPQRPHPASSVPPSVRGFQGRPLAPFARLPKGTFPLLTLWVGAACSPHPGSTPSTASSLCVATSPQGLCDSLRSLALPASLPPVESNRFADNEDAAQLGFRIFFDARFSSNNEVRCATCHAPERSFHDGKKTSMGLARVPRNSPSILNSGRQTVWFWDGRADSLWSQPLWAFENEKEMDFSRVEIARRVAQSYRLPYEALFGPLPPLDDTKRFPEKAKPGEAAWDAMEEADRQAINRVAANVGKALEAYQRKVVAGRAPFDRFAEGDGAALTEIQKQGFSAFQKHGCLQCHGGPLFTDQKFHNLGLTPDPSFPPDEGRAKGWKDLQGNPFNLQGPFSDAPHKPPAPPAPTPADVGAFFTPSLRNVGLTAPYGHNGSLPTLEDAIRIHFRSERGPTPPSLGTLDDKLPQGPLPPEDLRSMVEFLQALTGEAPPSPWNNWPDR